MISALGLFHRTGLGPPVRRLDEAFSALALLTLGSDNPLSRGCLVHTERHPKPHL